MADESPGLQWHQKPFEVIGVLILISVLASGLIMTLKDTFCIDLSDASYFRSCALALDENTPLGTRVVTAVGTDVLSTAKRGILLGFQPEGAFGFLTDGPLSYPDGRWWEVDFEHGADGWVPESALLNDTIPHWLRLVRTVLIILGLALGIAAIFVTVYTFRRIDQIRAEEKQRIIAAMPDVGRTERNERWEHILELVNSDRPGDWRVAVIEADIVLDELVTRMGYRGESLGEKLKQIEKGDFQTLDLAWEGHKIRNRIAHQGSDYILTQREARRVIDLYREVFTEFYYI